MGKKDKITLCLRNKGRLKRVATALGLTYSDLADGLMGSILEDLEADIQKAEEASSSHLQIASQKLEKHSRMITGNSVVRDALEASRASQSEEAEKAPAEERKEVTYRDL